jgi:hypothetical protein
MNKDIFCLNPVIIQAHTLAYNLSIYKRYHTPNGMMFIDTDVAATYRYHFPKYKYSCRRLGVTIDNVVNQALAAAQIRKLGADTGKSRQETENLKVEGKILSADALTRAAQNEQALEIGNSTIYVNHSIANYYHATKLLLFVCVPRKGTSFTFNLTKLQR